MKAFMYVLNKIASVVKKEGNKMGTRQIVRYSIYGILFFLFVYVNFKAIDNLFAEKTAHSSRIIPISKMPIRMPSMTICPTKTDYNSVFVEAKHILTKPQDFKLDISVNYRHEK